MLVPVDDIAGEDDAETRRLRQMAINAWEYVTSFSWSLPITGAWFAGGVGGVVALFQYEFEGTIGETDDRLWVVVGDIPNVYMIAGPDGPQSAQDALQAYCVLMDDWVDAVLVTHDFDGVYPVAAAETQANAESLRSRLGFIRREILPSMDPQPVDEPKRAPTTNRARQ